MLYNRITELFKIDIPIIQAGMVWASGWRLASAVSNAGGLGLIGAGSMSAGLLEEHIRKCKAATLKPFGVNIPLLYKDVQSQVAVVIAEKVPIVFTSAGSPAHWTKTLQSHGITVVHVVSSSKFALKAEEAGCNAVVAEGFEAGGHNGREETTTLVLTPLVSNAVKIPVIAAGGIATGRQMLAAMVLGAQGVQVGSRFVTSVEASCHINFKTAILQAQEGDTELTLKQLSPVRLLKNAFSQLVTDAQNKGSDVNALKTLLGIGRAKQGMFEGDLTGGELEIGQVSAAISRIMPAAQIVSEIYTGFTTALSQPLK